MYQDIEEPVDVIAIFENGAMKPLRFRWNGRAIKVHRVTGTWKADVGQSRIRYFAVLDNSANFFQLAYDERNTVWVLNKIWVE
jgi:hypothetical protein